MVCAAIPLTIRYFALRYDGGLIEDSPQRHIFSLNPKSEYRNPKQIRITKIQMTETLDKSFREFTF
jgi:hypothetical protein